MSDNLLFDPTLTEEVSAALVALGAPAVVDHYEPGMAQVRLDPTDDRPKGYVAVAGTTNSGVESWVLMDTVRDDSGFYDTTGTFVDLDLAHDTDVEVVARAIVRATFLDANPVDPARN
jgi:hypothetical protein